MTIKQFTKGQTAYILGDENATRAKKVPVAAAVSKVGRKYVTVRTGGGWDMQFEETGESVGYLTEHTECGAPRMLFPSICAAAEHIERDELKLWAHRAFAWDELNGYTLEQFLAVKRIIEGCAIEGGEAVAD